MRMPCEKVVCRYHIKRDMIHYKSVKWNIKLKVGSHMKKVHVIKASIALVVAGIGYSASVNAAVLDNPVAWNRSIEKVQPLTVIKKPACVGGIELNLDSPKFGNATLIGELSVNDSSDGRYWVITQSSKVISTANLTSDAIIYKHSSSAQMVCHKRKFDTIQLINNEVVVTHNGQRLAVRNKTLVDVDTGKAISPK